MAGMELNCEQRKAESDWQKNLWRLALLAAILVLVSQILGRPSVPASSRLAWMVFFGVLSLGAVGRACGAWRRLRRFSR
jgi:pheromone shutdown protein TraB